LENAEESVADDNINGLSRSRTVSESTRDDDNETHHSDPLSQNEDVLSPMMRLDGPVKPFRRVKSNRDFNLTMERLRKSPLQQPPDDKERNPIRRFHTRSKRSFKTVAKAAVTVSRVLKATREGKKPAAELETAVANVLATDRHAALVRGGRKNSDNVDNPAGGSTHVHLPLQPAENKLLTKPSPPPPLPPSSNAKPTPKFKGHSSSSASGAAVVIRRASSTSTNTSTSTAIIPAPVFEDGLQSDGTVFGV
jgi:hypothetical protein